MESKENSDVAGKTVDKCWWSGSGNERRCGSLLRLVLALTRPAAAAARGGDLGQQQQYVMDKLGKQQYAVDDLGQQQQYGQQQEYAAATSASSRST